VGVNVQVHGLPEVDLDAAAVRRLRRLGTSAGSGGAQVDEVSAVSGVVPDPGLVLGAVVEDHCAEWIPARFEPRPHVLALLGDQDVAQHRAGDLPPAAALDSESELALLEPQLPTELRELAR